MLVLKIQNSPSDYDPNPIGVFGSFLLKTYRWRAVGVMCQSSLFFVNASKPVGCRDGLCAWSFTPPRYSFLRFLPNFSPDAADVLSYWEMSRPRGILRNKSGRVSIQQPEKWGIVWESLRQFCLPLPMFSPFPLVCLIEEIRCNHLCWNVHVDNVLFCA